MQSDTSNEYFEQAVKFVNQTSRHIFLTGKAGTGKTTFLRHIKENTHKKLAIVAPTGIAAINAGGVTIHSLFQLPLGNFIPEQANIPHGNFYNRQGLLRHLKLNSSKRKIIQELELLVIDEVSMVRSDLLDAVDVLLKAIRKQSQVPFGGVQLLFIGDLFQLPPVVNDETWSVLKNYYKSPFFFHAHCLLQSPPIYLELKKIYRQQDETFIRLLNNLRSNRLTDEDINFLNKYYQPDFKPAQKGEYIILTTHNNKADQINKRELDLLPGKIYSFKAALEGEFNEKSIPAEMNLQLKNGSQIMFIRNDKGEARRYFNGKIATVSRIENNNIYVLFPGEDVELKLEKETWENVNYKYNSETDQIDANVLGKYIQYPIRLAWAITIHKSQGLTFTKAIIDAGASFAAGQVYVALSRLTSMEGLVLYSPIHKSSILTNEEALALASTEYKTDELAKQLEAGQKQYIHQWLIQIFNWSKLVNSLEEFQMDLQKRKISSEEEAASLFVDLIKKAKVQHITAEKFIVQLTQLLNTAPEGGYNQVYKRVNDAGKYFLELLFNELFIPLQEHHTKFKNLKMVKKYLKDLSELVDDVKNKKYQIEQAMKLAEGLVNGKEIDLILQQDVKEGKYNNSIEDNLKTNESKNHKQEKGASHRMSLELFKEGKSIDEIARERGLAKGTIEGHLISFITTGELDMKEFVSEEKVLLIQEAINELGSTSSSPIKEKLGKDFSYGEIRAVINFNKKFEGR